MSALDENRPRVLPEQTLAADTAARHGVWRHTPSWLRRAGWDELERIDARVAELDREQSDVHKQLLAANEAKRKAEQAGPQALAAWHLGGRIRATRRRTCRSGSTSYGTTTRRASCCAITCSANASGSSSGTRKRLVKQADAEVESARRCG